jgi:peptidyl-prolyl cis-trans isomerase B (cyclophilin B)
LDNKHSVFGEVAGEEDQKVVNSIVAGDKIGSITITGDYSELAEAHKDQLYSWNSVLKSKRNDL